MAPKHNRAPSMAEIQQQLQDTVTPESTVATSGIGRHLTELRRSGAAGGHVSSPRGNRTRHDQNRNAIRDSRDN